jgi:hypothetical protein
MRRRLDLRLRSGGHGRRNVKHIDLIPERRPDGTVVLRAVLLGPVERLRRLLQITVRR